MDPIEVNVEQQGQQGQQQPPNGGDPALEAEARRGGWRPKEEWRGDPNIWVDASTFVKRGREMAPHLARQAGELRRENTQMREQLNATQQELQTMREQVTALTTFRQEISQREHTRTREQLMADYKAARVAGNVDLEMQLLDKITALPPVQPSRGTASPTGSGGSAIPPGGNPSSGQPPRNTTQLPPELTTWVSQNDWYRNDPVLQQAMTVVGAELRQAGHITQDMSLTEQLNATARVVLQRYAPPPMHGGPRFEGGRPGNGGPGNGGSGGGGNSQEGTYEALPAHIKQACDAQGVRLGLIGDKKAFKDQASWRAYYAKTYFESPDGYDFRPPGN